MQISGRSYYKSTCGANKNSSEQLFKGWFVDWARITMSTGAVFSCPMRAWLDRNGPSLKVDCHYSGDFYNSTPLASKVHCSINGLENSSSPEYSKVQHLLEITVGLFSVGVGLFFVTGGLGKSPPPTKKSPTPTEKSPTLTVKSPTYKKSSSNQKKVLLQRKKVLL